MSTDVRRSHNNWLILGIMAALIAWGAFHALGAFLYNHDPRKPLIVGGCVGAFLLFWAVMLRVRRRPSGRRIPPDGPQRSERDDGDHSG